MANPGKTGKIRLKLFATTALILTLVFGVIPAQSHADVVKKIAVAYDTGGPGDNAGNDLVAVGVARAKKNFHLSQFDLRVVVTDGSERDRLKRLRFLANAGYNEIIAVGTGYAKSVATISLEFLDINFSIIDDSTNSNLNVASLVFNEAQGAYLAGTLAATASKSGKVAYLGDAQNPKSQIWAKAFSDGAIAKNPMIKVTTSIPENGLVTAATSTLFAAKNDVLYSTWSANPDVLNQILVLNTAKQSMKLIGLLPEQYFLQSAKSKAILLGDVTKRYDIAVYDAISLGRVGQFSPDVLRENPNVFGRLYGVADGGITLTLAAAGQSYKAAMNSVSSALKTGKVKVAWF